MAAAGLKLAASQVESKQFTVDVRAVLNTIALIPSADVAHQILRIAQEAVSNAVRHSSCTQVNVRLEQTNLQLLIAIADDGKGFVLDSLNDLTPHEHFGILGMRERARAIGGILTIRPRLPGTVVSLQLPMQERKTRWDTIRATFRKLGYFFPIRDQRQ